MSHINKTPAGSFRANWRDPSGRQLSKTFNTKKEASAFLAEIESSINRGTYVALAAGTGLRWGECIGLRLDAIGYIHPTSGKTLFDNKWSTMRKAPQLTVRIVRVAVEVAGTVSHKPYPKSRAGRRVVPLPPFATALLREHLKKYPPNALGEIFTNTAGGPLRRTLFRSRVWRPALVRAGLLGKVLPDGEGAFLAVWSDDRGLEQTMTFFSEKLAVAHVAKHSANGLRFHDLRHSYATWLISDGVPVNDVARILGHEQISTTLNLYTHSTTDRHERVMTDDLDAGR